MARGINKVILLGNLAADPEYRVLQNGTSGMTTCSIATNETYKDQQGQYQERTEWHRLVFWGKLAEVARDYLRKGVLIYVEGKLRTRSYDDKQNIKHYVTEIQVTDLQLLSSRTQNQMGQNGQYQNNGYSNQVGMNNQYSNNYPPQGNMNNAYAPNNYQQSQNFSNANNGYIANNQQVMNGYSNQNNNFGNNNAYGVAPQSNPQFSPVGSYQGGYNNATSENLKPATENVASESYQNSYANSEASSSLDTLTATSTPSNPVPKEPDMNNKPFATSEDDLPF